MSETVVVLGSKGRFGRAAVSAFQQEGWRVRALARAWDGPAPDGVEPVAGDAMDQESLIEACRGADVVVNAVNPPYPEWARVTPTLTANVIAAAKASDATVMIPGNVYNFGPLGESETMPSILTEDLPQRPCSAKGALRVQMEAAYADAARRDGVRTIVLRGGDFIEAERTGNWFDSQMTTELRRGRFTYPGPLDQRHAWAYLPDMGRAMAALAAKRSELPAYCAVGFPGYALTGREMARVLERVTGRKLSVKRTPWGVLRLLSIASPLLREVVEMRYLWDEAHAIDGARFHEILPDFRATPIQTALTEAVRDHLATS